MNSHRLHLCQTTKYYCHGSVPECLLCISPIYRHTPRWAFHLKTYVTAVQDQHKVLLIISNNSSFTLILTDSSFVQLQHVQ